jgi:cytochrome o ubiquinol oxidase subunit IV
MEEHAERRSERWSYIAGLALAVVLSAVPFGCVALSGLPRHFLLWIIAACGVVQIVVHFRYFLHIDLSKSKRDDLQLILFSFLILLLMVAGTIWILSNLHTRMM